MEAMITSHPNIMLAQSAISRRLVRADLPSDYGRKGLALLFRMVTAAACYFTLVLLAALGIGLALRSAGVSLVMTAVTYAAAEVAFGVWWRGRSVLQE